ncbi:MAG TPA: DUF4153 domain-containing protein [Stellaceae bacterium]|nr:DUF4153 domain-containing protein [Stellaceae bacterium]
MLQPTCARNLPAVPIARLVTGLAQGVALCLLYSAAENGYWPATHGLVFAPLLLVACLVPIVVLNGVGNIRPRSLLIWAAAAAVVLAGLAVHDIARGADGGNGAVWGLLLNHRDDLAIWPSPLLLVFSAVGLFIGHALVVAGDSERRIIATYTAYFDAAWKHGVQLALSFLFVLLFWVVLELGAGLFKLIDIDFLQRLIGHRWFALPATTLALACALHVTDARAGIVRGIRVLVLTLLSWLLPLMALLVLGFLGSLPVTGLAPLWATRFATALLLTSAAALVVLVNAAYQDGDAQHAPPRLLRYAGTAAPVLLLPLVVIAAYALSLRVAQHGWTTGRIIALSCLVVAACYALGYAWAVLRPGPWLARVAPCNVVAAFVVLGVLLALFTPLADPARLSVASQVARLKSGAVSPAKFDFTYLRFDGARYGKAALEQLKTVEEGAQAAEIRRYATAALEQKGRWQAVARGPLTAQELAQNLTVYPTGRALPASFVEQHWTPLEPQCLTTANAVVKCDAVIIDLDGDGKDEILLLDSWRAIVIGEDGKGGWRAAGQLDGPLSCAAVRDAVRAGRLDPAPPQRWHDVAAAGRRLRFVGRPEENAGCP